MGQAPQNYQGTPPQEAHGIFHQGLTCQPNWKPQQELQTATSHHMVTEGGSGVPGRLYFCYSEVLTGLYSCFKETTIR